MKNLLISTVCLFLLIDHADAAEPELMAGDWTIEGEETVRDEYIRLDGSLILPQGAKLTLEYCTLEIVGDYSRHHLGYGSRMG